jgi:uncharacterized membrane protein
MEVLGLESHYSNNDHNNQDKQNSPLHKAIVVGFVGGIFWSIIGSLAYYFNFSEVSHASYTLRSFWQASWTDGLLGELISIVIISLISIIISLGYYFILRNQSGMWPGVLYGLLLWFIVMYFLNPLFLKVPTLTEMDSTTVITTICLFILYGTFIGYSISYEYEQLNAAKQHKNKNSQNS